MYSAAYIISSENINFVLRINHTDERFEIIIRVLYLNCWHTNRMILPCTLHLAGGVWFPGGAMQRTDDKHDIATFLSPSWFMVFSVVIHGLVMAS